MFIVGSKVKIMRFCIKDFCGSQITNWFGPIFLAPVITNIGYSELNYGPDNTIGKLTFSNYLSKFGSEKGLLFR